MNLEDARQPMTMQFGEKKIQMVAKLAGAALALGLLSGCQSIAGNPNLSQVRIIDASPDAPGLDVYQGSAVLAYNLGLGTVTSYIPILPGAYPILVDAAGTRQQLVTASGTFLTNAQYTVLIGDFAADLHELILKDQSQPAPTGDISLRIIDQSARTGALDVYLVPSGATIVTTQPFLTDVVFNQNTGYMNVPAGAYTLAIVPAGTIPTATTATLYTGASVTYPGGAAKTIVLIDSTVMKTPAIQVVTANDYDPAGEGS